MKFSRQKQGCCQLSILPPLLVSLMLAICQSDKCSQVVYMHCFDRTAYRPSKAIFLVTQGVPLAPPPEM